MQDHVERKGVKGLTLAGHQEVLCGFGLRTGDCGNTADGAGDCGRLAQPITGYWEEPGKVSYGILVSFCCCCCCCCCCFSFSFWRTNF